jgi:arylsulfatase A-like enzyme
MGQAFRYHLGLWTANVTIFLVLDFAKRIDDLLYGLTLPELATNIGVVTLLCSPLCVALALLSMLIERLAGMRVAHGVAIFGLITVNLWSLKVGLAPWLESFREPARIAMALVGFVTALAASAWSGYRLDSRRESWQAKTSAILVFWTALVFFGLSAGLRGAGPSSSGQSSKPNVILITMDALSAKHTSVYGYERQTTPHLAELANQSVVLERLHANFNVTGLALPSFNGYLSRKPAGKTLAESLREGGYPHTAFYSFWAPELFFLDGFAHAELTRSAMLRPFYRRLRAFFSERQLRWAAGLASEEWSYFNPYQAEYHDDIFWQTLHYPAGPSLQAALDYLVAHPQGAFVWVHLWPPHFPYLPDPDLRGKFGPGPEAMKAWVNVAYEEDQDAYVASLRNLYDESILSIDRQLGWFLGQLKEKGLFDNSYVIVSGDHGESFERGWLGHSGWPLMEVITHVPMVIHRPGDKKQIRVQTLAQQLDFAPTVLDLLDLPIPQAMPGESLGPYIDDPGRLSERYKISISLLASIGEAGQLAVYWKTFKLMFLSNDRSVYRLYNIFNDPAASKDISKEHPEIVKEMMKRLVLPPAGP